MRRPHTTKKTFAPRPWLEALQPGATIAIRNENYMGKPEVMKTLVVKKVTARHIITSFAKFSRMHGYDLHNTWQNYWAIDKELTETRRSLKMIDEVA